MPNCIRAATTAPSGGQPVAAPDNSASVGWGCWGDVWRAHQVGDIRWGDIRWGDIRWGALGGGHWVGGIR